ncbi:MAG: hypothetical protein CVV44_07935 [Spirochaetae bacterium HGW-Spirochaetae-1]|jgi:hypothetical protein|nr:MAG: hypothetical protein CVV44_07935 [Spirochaetae bacterium HGW-Spirochaetae-1]
MGDCIRYGTCCQDVRLAEQPYMLQTAYEYWLKTPKKIFPVITGVSITRLMMRVSDAAQSTSFVKKCAPVFPIMMKLSILTATRLRASMRDTGITNELNGRR